MIGEGINKKDRKKQQEIERKGIRKIKERNTKKDEEEMKNKR